MKEKRESKGGGKREAEGEGKRGGGKRERREGGRRVQGEARGRDIEREKGLSEYILDVVRGFM